uniref:Disease resistance protein RPM1 n=1 Tax=Triticum urartu TaxID=4572 RepID=A0A8R7QZQ7_TRIUA
MRQKLKIKEITDRINDYLKRQGCQDQILVILKLDDDYVSEWEETRNEFSLLDGIAGALMLTFEENRAEARQYCWPRREPIDYSLLGLYRDTALELNKMEMTEDSWQIFLDILDNCKSNEFCMKIFVHALYANPKRSIEELCDLCNALQQVSDNSVNNIDKKMLKFSYSDLPKDYKSCLLYLAIFPRRQPIRRSTLIGRWVIEGLVTKEDWESTVRHANQCFDVLVTRWLVYPADTGSTGQVKSCVIGDQVHGFITKIAKKHGILEKRLSHHLARHFSIFNHLRLRSSDRIDKFFSKLFEESSRVSLIKVLDLEGCQCFGGKNGCYLKDICNKMLLLKYLSLRGTNVTQLPSEINNLRELEVLDIRDTRVPATATVKVLLLKLKRLLAGRIVLNTGQVSTELSSVNVPDKVEKMLNMEVLSNVKAQNSQDLKDIGKLWRLRKLGVVIEHKEKHLRNLLRAISDLHECLMSLSITLSISQYEPSHNEDFTPDDLKYMVHPPKLLESLSITGTSQRGQLLRQLTNGSEEFKLAKVTLTRTKLTQSDLEVLAKLPNIVCLRLREKACRDSKLTFSKEEFKTLKCFLVEGSNMTDILFEGGALKLEKITLCSTDGIQSLSGVEALPELKEVELKNGNKLSLFEKAKNISKNLYAENNLTFKKDNFPWLNHLIIDFSVTTKISFDGGTAPKLEKIVCSFTTKLQKIDSSFTKETVGTLNISGIDNLPKLKELEFNG